jgi:hypothetical protein
MKIFRATFVALWVLVVGAGTFFLWGYENAPGVKANSTPSAFPAESGILHDGARPSLMMFAHPHCPCTRASLAELSRLMTVARGRIAAHVLFIKPDGAGAGWVESDLWAGAAAIPGVRVAADEGGREAARFGAGTSGLTLLYGADGRLLFSGGVTAARGHEGDNAGRDALAGLLTSETGEASETPVFGCQLFDSECEWAETGNAIHRH